MFEILVVGGIATFFVGLGFCFGRASVPDPEIPEVEEAKFNCPYCTIEITGHKNLDLINHVSCISKSEEDIALDAKRRKSIAEYFTRFFVERREVGGAYDGFEYNHRTGEWTRVRADIFRNGKKVESVRGVNTAAAKVAAEKTIEFWKYKDKVSDD